jgi:hypothetical protein
VGAVMGLMDTLRSLFRSGEPDAAAAEAVEYKG